MKKLLVISMITLMSLFVITGCTSSNSNEPATEVEKTENTDSKKEEVIAEEPKKEEKKTQEKSEVTAQDTVEETKEDKNAEAYKAYLEFLTSHPELNISDWDNLPKKVISVCDCYGDEYPELIYTKGFSYSDDETIGGHELHIATYQNGQITELPIDISFDIVAAGSACISLFNSGNGKDLYYLCTYADFGDDFDGRMCDFKDLYKIDGSDKLLFSCECGWDSESGDDIYVYYKDGNKISESEFNSGVGDIISNVKLIYQCHDNLENGDVYGIGKNMKEKADIMTYDEAVAFLQK